MTSVQALVVELAAFPGVEGCALVDADTGMTWHHAGKVPDMEQIGEASVEFWRVHKRLSPHLKDFGTLNSSAQSFTHRDLALFPCSHEPALVLVCVARKGKIDWVRWGEKFAGLKQVLSLPRRTHQPVGP